MSADADPQAGPLAGRVALVTGATRGVGRGVAAGLGEAGATVYVTGRTTGGDNSVEAGAAEVTRRGGHGRPLVVDHGDDRDCARAVEAVLDEAGAVDILVNNAFATPDPWVWESRFWELPLSLFDGMQRVGVRSAYVMSSLVAPAMVDRGQGLIVNISSAAGKQYFFSVAYGVGKAAVDKMSADMAVDLRPFGVAAVSLWPSLVRTTFFEEQVRAGRLTDDGTAQSPILVGRAVAALAASGAALTMSGEVVTVAALAERFGLQN